MKRKVRPSDAGVEAAPFDPMNPETWPDGIWQFLPNLHSDRDRIEAYKFWLTTEAAKRTQAPAEPPASAVIGAEEAAQLLGITVDALYARTGRHKVPGRLPGRRLEFHREKFLEGLKKRAR